MTTKDKLQEYREWEAEGRAPYLPVDDMKPYYLYKVHCRNFSYGLWLPDQYGCMGRRQKFYDWFLFVEHHKDASKDFGTLRPLRELEKSPFGAEDFKTVAKMGKYGEYYTEASHNEIFEYLKTKEKEYDEKDGRA